ncbi:MAG TPA: 6,7-dimethyl-8-ribityllumazine synthase [Terriglobia bacterium]|jgi:6,7-dimethyl-8-ribityllumazine synthase|nr:6,7-dimethyl-8-ribityllumazine synthase [Terriglobia bacterium]
MNMYRFAIVASEYNSVIVNRLIDGALKALKGQKQVSIIRVPGSFEIPLAAKRAALSKKYDAIVAIGCVVRGETSHFEYISSSVSHALQSVALETGLPVGFGVLTVDTVQQAMDRSGESGNKGAEAALTALAMIDVLHEI